MVAARLGDRVRHWITLNEPWVIAWLGYGYGIHAPGRTSTADAIAAAHHVLLSHGLATEILRRESPGSQVGVSIDLEAAQSASDAPEDVEAARAFDGHRNRWFLDPSSAARIRRTCSSASRRTSRRCGTGTWRAIAAPIDFLGVNYYQRRVVAGANGAGWQFVHQDDSTHTDIGWEVSPGRPLRADGAPARRVRARRPS